MIARDRRDGCARMGLPTDAVVGIQLPNTVENFLTHARRAARRHDRRAVAAAVAPRRCRCRAGARRRQGADRPAAASARSIMLEFAHARRGGSVFRSAMSAASAPICPTASSRSTICSPRRRSIRPLPLDRERGRHAAAHVAVVTFDVGDERPGAGRAQPFSSCWPAGLPSCSKAGWRRTPSSFRRWRRPRSRALPHAAALAA